MLANVLKFVNEASSTPVEDEETTRDIPEDRALNLELATESIVPLKNTSFILPASAD